MKVKLDRDESLLYIVNDNPRLASRWMVELTISELEDFKECERKYFAWQNKFEDQLCCAEIIKDENLKTKYKR